MSDLRVAVVGLGMGMVRAQQVVDTPGAELVAVADLNPARLATAAAKFPDARRYSSFDALLADADDVEVVYVMTESGTHAQYGMAAARAGKHVISTKPIETTIEKAIEFNRVCESCGVKLLVDFQMRYEPAVQKARAAVSQGALGQPLFGEVKLKWWRGEDYYEGWHGTWALDGGGSVMNQAIHFVDCLGYLLGDVAEVFAFSGVHAHVNCETEDMTNGVLKFVSGAEGLIHTTTAFPGKAYDLVEVHGTHGALAVDLTRLLRWEFKRPGDVGGTWEATSGATVADGSSYEPELTVVQPPRGVVEDAIRVIRDGAEPFCTGWDAIKPVAVAMALYESARSHQPVQVRSSFA